MFNFVDRQILAILAAPIQRDLGLSDGEMGMLGGIAFALLYSTLAVPLGALADRTSRSWVITVSLVLWSGFTALCGLAQGFWHIFLARLGVGIGEAGGVAPSYALIGDYFPSEKRASALSIYSLGIPLGSAAGVLAGGYIAATVDWRLAFFTVGIAGLLIAPLFKLLVRDPRGSALAGGAAAPSPSLRETAAVLARKPSFWLLSFAAPAPRCSAMACSSVSELFRLSYDMAQMAPVMDLLPGWFTGGADPALLRLSVFYGSIVLVGGIAGTWLGGWLGDRTGPGDPGSYARIPAFCFAIALPVFALGLFAPTLWLGWLLFTFGQMLGLAWLGPVIAAVQHIVPPAMRATASAAFLFINNLIGIGFGTFFGFMSDNMGPAYGDQALKYSILYGLGFYALSALFYLFASRRLAKDWVG